MSLDFESQGFTGTLLAAMPGVQDPTFGRSVVLICAHSPDGAMGLIVNAPLAQTAMGGVDANIVAVLARTAKLHQGGPAETDRPFLLHSRDWCDGADTLVVDDNLAVTASTSALTTVASRKGPRRVLVALGYSAWGAGQLEAEVLANIWLSGRADPEIVFSDDCTRKWSAAVSALGASPGALSGSTGRA